MRCKSIVKIAETGYGITDRSSILCRERKFVLAVTSKPAMGHHASAFAVGG
jgi:hypothetical protein